MSTRTRFVRQTEYAFLACAALLSTPSFAQSGTKGQVELGLFGISAKHGDSLAVDRALGAGAHLGYFLTRMLSIEGTGDYVATNLTSTGERVNVSRLSGTIIAHARPTSWTAFYVGTGIERVFYNGALHTVTTGAHAVVGQRISLGGRAGLRVEGHGTFWPDVHLSVSAGLSVFAFGGPPRDQDNDRVRDKDDQCPRTPPGATVDEVGCPSDSDGDVVLDGLDTCPGTPSGATVDPMGCPSDSDGDEVLDGIDACPDTPAGAETDTRGCPTDGDADGIFDGLDRCPATPPGATTDETGCPLDGDGDRVFDGLDRCPRTPPGVAVDEAGCPTDTDGDGVLDNLDACPATPPGTEVDGRGCEVITQDTDGDGVVDPQDRCPNTAPGQNVDAVGCPVLFLVEQGQRRPLILQGVTFASGRSVLTEESYSTLDEVAASLAAHPEVRIEIAGHTDATGSAEVNTRLSLARARAVMMHLARAGIAPERMVAAGYGPDRPIASNGTPEGRARNRRVELSILDGGR
jgi:outer membrane protein OmpA-like peptidoglycan-associated protein